MQTPSSGWASFVMEVVMSEICLDCLGKLDGKRYRPSAVILDDDWCEVCCQYKPCVIRFRKPWERIKYLFGFRERKLTEEEWAALEAEEDAMLTRIIEEYAEIEGKRYLALNELLQNDPNAAVPPEVEQRAKELIEKHFFDQGQKSS